VKQALDFELALVQQALVQPVRIPL
jgi:hypothetical protein